MPTTSFNSEINLFASLIGTSKATISLSFTVNLSPFLVVRTSGSNGIIEALESLPLHNIKKTLVDLLRNAGSLIDKSCVELNQTRAGGDFVPRVLPSKDTA